MINKSCRLQEMKINIKWTIRDVMMTDRSHLLSLSCLKGQAKRGACGKQASTTIAQGAAVSIVLVRFDYGRKTTDLGPIINPPGDVTTGLAQIQSLFSVVEGKYPHHG